MKAVNNTITPETIEKLVKAKADYAKTAWERVQDACEIEKQIGLDAKPTILKHKEWFPCCDAASKKEGWQAALVVPLLHCISIEHIMHRYGLTAELWQEGERVLNVMHVLQDGQSE